MVWNRYKYSIESSFGRIAWSVILMAFKHHKNEYLASKHRLNNNTGVIFFESKSLDFSNNDHQKANIFDVR